MPSFSANWKSFGIGIRYRSSSREPSGRTTGPTGRAGAEGAGIETTRTGAGADTGCRVVTTRTGSGGGNGAGIGTGSWTGTAATAAGGVVGVGPVSPGFRITRFRMTGGRGDPSTLLASGITLTSRNGKLKKVGARAAAFVARIPQRKNAGLLLPSARVLGQGILRMANSATRRNTLSRNRLAHRLPKNPTVAVQNLEQRFQFTTSCNIMGGKVETRPAR